MIISEQSSVNHHNPPTSQIKPTTKSKTRTELSLPACASVFSDPAVYRLPVILIVIIN